MPQIEVTFDIDANGIVQVSAKDLGTGRHQEITITASSNLSDAEIDRAIREAAEYEATDGQRKAYIDARSEADTLIRQVEVAYKEKKKTIDSGARHQIKSSLSYIRNWSAVQSREMCPKSRRLSCSGQPRNCAVLQECLEYKRFQS